MRAQALILGAAQVHAQCIAWLGGAEAITGITVRAQIIQ